jgi:hypothetical protein
MDNLDQLIDLSEKKTDLLKEYKESLAYEQCTHDVRKDPGRVGRFMLFDIKTSQEVTYGSSHEVTRWLTRRGVKPEQTYNYKLLNP